MSFWTFSLLIGAFFAFFVFPREVGASFLSSILNTQAYAQSSDLNSQNMPLLQPKVSPAQLLASKDDKKDNPVDPKANINIVSDNSLMATATPISSTGDSDEVDFSEDQISVYVVKAGDTWTEIAEMYKVSVNTILWANNIPKGAKLVPGDVLLILPISGLEHTVTKGQTLKIIAALYKVDVSEIVESNDISLDTELAIGDKLIIPNAEIADDPVVKPKTGSGSVTTKGKISSSLPSVSGYFKSPISGYFKRTRGPSQGHRGVDLAAPNGTPIHAAAGGSVLIARNGYNGGFGNYVVIQHSNGMKTLYAHMSKLGTTVGEKVSQGEVIGYVGNTGDSRGNHLHIEVSGGKNPF